VTLTRIPAEFKVCYRERGAACSESTEGWTPAEAVERAHEMMREGARGVAIMRRMPGGCECDWALYLRVGPVLCWLRRLILGFRCGQQAWGTSESRRAVRRDALKHPGGCPPRSVASQEPFRLPPEGGTFPIDRFGHVTENGEPVGGTITITPSCRGFRWIGQSFATCDGCGKPAWEHDGMLRLREGATVLFGATMTSGRSSRGSRARPRRSSGSGAAGDRDRPRMPA
jgi:hypothetical protein